MMPHDDIGTKEDIAIISIQTSHRLLLEAKELMKHKYNEGASNRIYYSVFRSISAIHALDGNRFKSHKEALGQFNKNYVNENIFSREYGKKIHEIQILRHNTDYGYNIIPTDKQVKDNFDFANKLYNECKKYCERKLNKNISVGKQNQQ